MADMFSGGRSNAEVKGTFSGEVLPVY